MANPFKEAENKKKVPPGGEHKSVVKEEEVVVVSEPPTPKATDNPLEGMIEQKPEGKSHSFYLSAEAAQNLERLAKQNKCSKSKALDALLRSLS